MLCISSIRSLCTSCFEGRVTGLNTDDDDATEPIQVVNYGTGGHYEPHVDYFGPMVDAYQGDRVATMLYYLSDDIIGGKYINSACVK